MADCVTERHEGKTPITLSGFCTARTLGHQAFSRADRPIFLARSPIFAGRHPKGTQKSGLALRPDQLTQDLTSNRPDAGSCPLAAEKPQQAQIPFFYHAQVYRRHLSGLLGNGIEINRDLFLSGFAPPTPRGLYNMSFPCIIQNSSQLGLVLGSHVLKRLKKPSPPLPTS